MEKEVQRVYPLNKETRADHLDYKISWVRMQLPKEGWRRRLLVDPEHPVSQVKSVAVLGQGMRALLRITCYSGIVADEVVDLLTPVNRVESMDPSRGTGVSNLNMLEQDLGVSRVVLVVNQDPSDKVDRGSNPPTRV